MLHHLGVGVEGPIELPIPGDVLHVSPGLGEGDALRETKGVGVLGEVLPAIRPGRPCVVCGQDQGKLGTEALQHLRQETGPEVEVHLGGLEALAAPLAPPPGALRATAPDGLHGAETYQEFPSAGATENILLAAVLARGTTTIGNAAREPELADLADYLSEMGASIEGAGTSTIVVNGVDELRPADHRVVPDRLEAGTYIFAAAMTGGSVTIRDCVPQHLRMELSKLGDAGAEMTSGEDWIAVKGPDRPEPIDFATLPFPGYHTDMHPQMVALLSIADGTSIATENVYAARFRYIGELNRMGADIHTDGQHIVIRGVGELSGCEVDGCDIRAAAALTIAGLRADGTTTVVGAHHVDRGYDGFVENLRSLGAQIERV